jgi:ubiquinol-cytochrome c reductase cytochrome b subunit
MLGIQIITGVFLAMHYTPNIDLAFASIEHIMRDVNYGWLIRYFHSNGASMFFIVVYIHIARGLYFGSYLKPRHLLWKSGVVLFIVMMATAFMGYVLPWGQMSFWGATVITNLFSAIPFIGESIAYWLWGGFSVNNATLNRFFSLHYLLPFVIAALVFVHLYLLHQQGSSNPLGIESNADRISFYPYFYVKDLFGFLVFIVFYSFIVFYYPNVLGHSDNYIEANPLVTPSHIVPEWYFLPFYAILRSIPNKLFGVLLMGFSLIILLFVPYLSKMTIRSSYFRPLFSFFFWFFIFDVILLGWVGAKPAEDPFIFVGQLGTFYYFFFFMVILPILNKLDYFLLLNNLNKNK